MWRLWGKKAFFLCGGYFLLAVLFSGCSPARIFHAFMGTDIRFLRRLEDRNVSEFKIGKELAFSRTIAILRDMHARIFLQDPRRDYLVAIGFDKVYPRCVDTTEVGVFFTGDAANTRIVVKSLNVHLEKFVAGKLFEEVMKDRETTEE